MEKLKSKDGDPGRDPHPQIPTEPQISEGVRHEVTLFPNNSGWTDVIRHTNAASDFAKKNQTWNSRTISLNDPKCQEKLVAEGERAIRENIIKRLIEALSKR